MRKSIFALVLGIGLVATHAEAIDPQGSGATQTTHPSAPADPQTRQEVSRRAPEPSPARINGMWLLTSNDTYATFADQSQVTLLANGYRRMWVTGVYRQPQTDVKYSVALQEYNCSAREFRTVSGSFFDLSDHVLGSIPQTEFSPVIPHSVADGVLTLACANPAQWGNGGIGAVLLPRGLAPRAYADRVVFASLPSNSNLIGIWGLAGDCANALILRADGSFAMNSTKGGGRWSLGVNTLHLDHQDGTAEDAPINWSNENNFRLTLNTGAVMQFRRC